MVGDKALDYGRDDLEVLRESSAPMEWVARYTKSRINARNSMTAGLALVHFV